ncbi:MAG: DnaJ domain-containing protein [Caldilineaceae bacterium SB0665_bin_21]|nr:DnaJ domain-containing protein [Caldilineaceae bacterium SB0665_bin_21]MYC63242.1 DnaJ domain-containing protein [Caldilineaceae bacterium SB0661_bin_34]
MFGHGQAMATVHKVPPKKLATEADVDQLWARILRKRHAGHAFHYDVLEVPLDASHEEIRVAYRSWMIRLDRFETKDPDVESLRRKVENAWAVLSDPVRRERYDAGVRGMRETGRRFAPSSEIGRAADRWTPESPDYLGLRQTSERLEVLDVLKVVNGSIEFRPVPSRTNQVLLHRKLLAVLPAEELRFDALRQLWMVPAHRLAALRSVFQNVDSLLEQAGRDRIGFKLPDYTVPQKTTEVQERPPKPTFRVPEQVAPTGQQPFYTIIVVALVLLTGWNLYVAADNSRTAAAEATAQASVPVPVITPIPIVQPTAAPVPEPTPVVLAARTAYPRVHLRRRPDLNAYSLTLLLAGEELEALGRSADTNGNAWIRIRRGDYLGWSAAWTLELEGEAGQLPVLEAQ